jgi:hypothetical protein
MSNIASLIRQTTAGLFAVQDAMQIADSPRTAAQGDAAASAALIAELKDAIDRTRSYLWRCGECASTPRDSADPTAGTADPRLKLVSKLLWLLSRRTAPGDSAQEENMSFFERIDSISDRLLAEHPENKVNSKAA